MPPQRTMSSSSTTSADSSRPSSSSTSSSVTSDEKTTTTTTPWPCERCQCSFTRRKLLDRHDAEHHPNIRLRCRICCDNHFSTTLHSFQRHSKRVHLAKHFSPSVMIEQCQRLYESESDDDDDDGSSAESQFSSKSDDDVFVDSESASQSESMPSAAPSTSTITSVSASSGVNRKSGADVATKRFQCDLCDYVGQQKSKFVRHVQTQHEGLRYVCERCLQCYRSHSGFQSHFLQQHDQQLSIADVDDPAYCLHVRADALDALFGAGAGDGGRRRHKRPGSH